MRWSTSSGCARLWYQSKFLRMNLYSESIEIVFATIAAAGCIVDLKLTIVFIPFSREPSWVRR